MILKNINYVVENSSYVKINVEKIEDLLPLIKNNKTINWFSNFSNKFNKEETILILFLTSSINFCFWNNRGYKEEYNEVLYSSSEAVFISLVKYFIKKEEKLNIDYLKSITFDEFKNIFNEELFLLKDRYDSFMKTISVIYEDYDNFFYEILKETDCEKLLRNIINKFDNFKDTSFYKGKEIEFFKRAIVLVKDLYYNVEEINKNIENIDCLPACADYNVPRFLYDNGILEYSKVLVEKIKNNEEIIHNSEEEIEIRANMIFAVKKIKEKLEENNQNINMVDLDNILWNLAKKDKKSNSHRTISIFY